jgi:hypothetical protein
MSVAGTNGAAPVWRPTGPETELLRAGLWQPQRGLPAWRHWRRRQGDLDEVEAGAQRLLPLVYRNLLGHVDGPDVGLLKVLYRRAWTTNQFNLRAGRRAISALEAAGIETLVLKGAALGAAHYRDPGARPMADFDLAVPPGSVRAALAALEQTGFTSRADDAADLLRTRHSESIVDEDGFDVDLHAGVIWRPGLERLFWEGAVQLELGGLKTLSLCPADLLFHVCVHGAAWNEVRPIRWAADAYKVIESSEGDLDWGRLADLAISSRLTLPLAEALRYLGQELEAPVPPGTAARLESAPVAFSERRAYKALARPPSPRRSAYMLWWIWERYRAQAGIDAERPNPIGFIRYMQGFWALENPGRVPLEAGRRLLRRRA